MSEVKWIKITTDMFSSSKIRYLRSLPDGNSIVLIWVMLLTMAGRCNSDGMIMLTEDVPYTAEMLANELGFDIQTIKLAVDAFERLGMIAKVNDALAIDNWDEYQSAERLNELREQNRNRQRRFRQKAREKAQLDEPKDDSSRDSNVTPPLQQRYNNALDIDIDIESKEEIPKGISKKAKPKKSDEPKHRHGVHDNVLLTDSELDKLKERFPGDYAKRIDDLSWYLATHNVSYKSHYLTILSWARQDEQKGATPKVDSQTLDAINFAVDGS